MHAKRGTERQDHPEWQVNTEMRRCQEGIGIGADRVKSDVTEIEQPCIADHDVQTKRQEDVENREVGNSHPSLATERGNERHRH
jgi:hypothetical protein